jgi:hypothetical protein
MPSILEITYVILTRIFHSHHLVLRLKNAQPQSKVYIELYALFYFCDISNFTLILLFYANIDTGIYAFKVHGQIYHKIDQLIPGGKGSRHMQLYFYDTDESMVQRRNISSHLDQNLIQEILRILSDVAKNPYIHHFKILGQYGNIEEYNIELNSSISVDQRRFNAPAMDQVAAIWQDDSDEQRKFKRSIMIYANSGHATFIRDYHGCYDPLAYPLFYPGGETG